MPVASKTGIKECMERQRDRQTDIHTHTHTRIDLRNCKDTTETSERYIIDCQFFRSSSHCASSLRESLHWLLVRQRVVYQNALITLLSYIKETTVSK